MTKFVKKADIQSKWFEIDATDAVVGRIATVVSKIIRGKNKTTFTPHMDHGDFVVVKNVDLIKFTGNKFQDKKYFRHTGHPGGIKPGGALAKKQLGKLKIYAGSNHPHEAQNPEKIELSKLNSKNLVRN